MEQAGRCMRLSSCASSGQNTSLFSHRLWQHEHALTIKGQYLNTAGWGLQGTERRLELSCIGRQRHKVGQLLDHARRPHIRCQHDHGPLPMWG